MPRAKIYGFIALAVSTTLAALFVYFAIYQQTAFGRDFLSASTYTYYAITIPITIVVAVILGNGFWIGWTILTIKVAPPMPEIVEKKDYAKIKAFLLCLSTLSLAALFIYGVYLKSYWALAVPAGVVTLIILGMVFWVGYAIVTTRRTLPEEKKN
jgi:uncharacterized protein with PQ loop repeat